jgi:hypothetical protein
MTTIDEYLTPKRAALQRIKVRAMEPRYEPLHPAAHASAEGHSMQGDRR